MPRTQTKGFEGARIWLFQANPKIWDLAQFLEEVEEGAEDDWPVPRYRDKVPIAVIAAARLDRPLQYLALVADVIYPEEYEGRTDAVKAITQRFTTALENMVRQYPEQYFWLHRRWKHQPAVSKKRAA